MEKSKKSVVRTLKPWEWPLADQISWADARRPHGRLTRGGTAALLKPVSQSDLEKRYGLFLDHTARSGMLSDIGTPAASVTPENVESYVRELTLRVSSVTVQTSIAKLKRMAQILNPQMEWRWLQDIENDLALDMRPASKFERIVASDTIVLAGLTLMEEAETAKKMPRLQRVQSYRNGLMIALLAVCPIRLKNLSALTLDKNILRVGGHWCIVLRVEETKEKRPDQRPIPPFLTVFIDRYISVYQPLFKYKGQVLWVGRYGKPLGYSAVERVITETTRLTLGIAISPHLFRACAASTAYMHTNGNYNLASPLLNHRGSKTTREHYDRGTGAFYGREFGKLLDNM
jgi:integrase